MPAERLDGSSAAVAGILSDSEPMVPTRRTRSTRRSCCGSTRSPRSLLQSIINALLSADADAVVGAEWGRPSGAGPPWCRDEGYRDGQVRRFQGLIAGRRALLLLDNAASAEQVRPLLPEVGSCLVLVTSRRALAGTGAADVPLDVFTVPEAVLALRDAAQPVAVGPGSDDAVRIVGLVGQLPLAVALVGARIRGAADWTLADHAARLAEARESRELDAGVELALGLSYDRLYPDQRRLLRWLTLHPGRDVDRHAAAALADATPAETDAALAGSSRPASSRDMGPTAGRCTTSCAPSPPTEPTRRTRRPRAVRSEPACSICTTRRSPVGPRSSPPVGLRRTGPPAPPTTPAPELDDGDDAQRWLDVEWSNLLAAAFHPGEVDRPAYVVHLSIYLQRYLDVTGRIDEAEALHTRAVDLAQGEARAQALVNLANWPTGVLHPVKGSEHRDSAQRGCRAESLVVGL
jgi:hypothetical protein